MYLLLELAQRLTVCFGSGLNHNALPFRMVNQKKIKKECHERTGSAWSA
jgi:vacuolar-type H+-ATPase subunit B/Vma2